MTENENKPKITTINNNEESSQVPTTSQTVTGQTHAVSSLVPITQTVNNQTDAESSQHSTPIQPIGNQTNPEIPFNIPYSRPPLNSDPNLNHYVDESLMYDNRGYEFSSPYGDQIYGYPYPPHMLYPQQPHADPRYPFPTPMPPHPQMYYPIAHHPEHYIPNHYYPPGHLVHPAQTHPASQRPNGSQSSIPKPLPIPQEQNVAPSSPTSIANSSNIPLYPSEAQQPVPVHSSLPPKVPAPVPDLSQSLPKAPTPPPETATASSPPQSPTHLSGTLPFVANPPLPPHVTLSNPIHNNPPPLPASPQPTHNNPSRINSAQIHPSPPPTPQNHKERSPFLQYLLEKNYKASVGSMPNRFRFALRVIRLISSVAAIILTSFAVKTLPSRNAPFGETSPFYFIYVICTLSLAIDLFQIIHYYYRRIHYHPKITRIYSFVIDAIILLFWFCDLLVINLRLVCPIGGFSGWCEIYNSNLFFSFTAAACALIICVWNIIGTWRQEPVQNSG